MSKELSLKQIHESVFWEEDDPKWTLTSLGHNKPSQYSGYKVDLARDSYIWAFTGWRGAGKSTSLTYFGMKSQFLYNMRLIANFPIEYRLNTIDGKSRIIKAEPLDLYKMLCFDEDYKNCLILIDEAPDIISHMAAMTWKNRLLNVWIRQLRKNRNSLMVGAQQFELLDKSFRWQTDIVCECIDASRKYGEESGLDRGETILLRFLDNSGMWTGQTWQQTINAAKQNGKYEDPGEECEIHPRFLWGDATHKAVYDTYFQQDVWESLKKVDLQIGKYSVGNEAQKEEENQASLIERTLNLFSQAQQDTGRVSNLYETLNATPKEKTWLGGWLKKHGLCWKQTGRNWYMDVSKVDIASLVESA